MSAIKRSKNTITRRWLVNSLGAIFIVLMSVLMAFSVFVNVYYYNSARQYITSRLNMVSGMLSQYYADNPVTFASEVRSMVENWSEKNRMELMTINSAGEVFMTSSGFAPTKDIIAQDYYDAIDSGSSGTFTGKSALRELCSDR